LSLLKEKKKKKEIVVIPGEYKVCSSFSPMRQKGPVSCFLVAYFVFVVEVGFGGRWGGRRVCGKS
jgi:hypothetical protein